MGPAAPEAKTAEVLARAAEATHVVASVFARVAAFRGTADMPERHAALLRRLQRAGTPLVVVSFGSPYILKQVPEAATYVVRVRLAGDEPARGDRGQSGRTCRSRAGCP